MRRAHENIDKTLKSAEQVLDLIDRARQVHFVPWYALPCSLTYVVIVQLRYLGFWLWLIVEIYILTRPNLLTISEFD